MAVCATPALASQEEGVINFEVSVDDEVSNDEANARLSKTWHAKTPKELAKQMNPIANQALTIAKKYPSLTITTGNTSGYPHYDDKGNLAGVAGSISLRLRTTNMEELSAALAELQTLLVVQDLDFAVSLPRKKVAQEHLQSKAIQQFQQEADKLVKLWHAKSYRLLQAQMNTQESYLGNSSFAPAPAMMKMVSDASYFAPPPAVEAGSSRLNYRVAGSIKLLY